jgi:hypothetical protein
VSELLQSQLLQPTNITPIQPRLAESNLFLISAGGPGALSFNEFNPIFNRNGASAQFSGLVGNNDTYGGELVLSAIQNRLSWSFGASSFNTDGWGDNTDQDDKIFNVFAQYELSYKTSIQAEYRYRDAEYGDLTLKFFPESDFFGLTNTSKESSIRLGARHSFSPNSIILATFAYQDSEFRQTHEPFPQPGVPLLDFNEPDQECYGGELQHLFRSRYVNLVSGGGYFDFDSTVDQSLTVAPPLIPGPPLTPPTIDVPDEFDVDNEHTNLYAYPNINLLRNMTITLGASYDHADSKFLDEDRDQFNPKLGIVWNPIPSTTFRAAAFRTLKRTLVTQQTLEPTQVAGFNQFFDDEELTETWHYGGAIDQKFSSSIYGGLEFTYRELTVPYVRVAVTGNETVRADWDEYIGRAYLFWTPTEWLSLRAEYLYEELDRDEDFPEGAENADTHRVPLGINVFHPSGLSASLTTTYYNQSGDFGGYFATDPIRHGDDDFWLVDMAINYRLPKRFGFFTVGATNLFDEDFNYFDSDLNNASIQPDRSVFARFTLAVP